MNAIKWSILAAALGVILGFGLLGPLVGPGDGNEQTIKWKIDNTTVSATVTRPAEAERAYSTLQGVARHLVPCRLRRVHPVG